MDGPRFAQDARERMAAAFAQRQHQAVPAGAVAAAPALDVPDALADRVTSLEQELADRERALAERERQFYEQLAKLAVMTEH